MKKISVVIPMYYEEEVVNEEEVSGRTFKISGQVWLDQDKNNKKDSEERNNAENTI